MNIYIEKVCTKCKISKKLSEFHKLTKSKDGCQFNCKLCVKETDAIRYEKDRDKILEYCRQYQQTHKKQKAIKQKNYRKNNYEKCREYELQYTKKNRKHKTKVHIEYVKNRCKVDSLFSLTCRYRSIIKMVFYRMGYKKNSKSQDILGCTFKEFKLYLESKFTEGMLWSNRGEWHIDHYIPLSTAKTEEDLIRLNHYTNLQPLWAMDNWIKGNKIPECEL